MVEEFVVITMLTKTDKKLYLSMQNAKPTWSFDPDEACVWDFEEEAQKFADNWFKGFKDYSIEPYRINIMEGVRVE
jgi:hypothetical protein